MARWVDEAGTHRHEQMRAWLDELEQVDALSAWTSTPAAARLTFANLHSQPVGA